jgi:hypothetical protein
VKRRKLLSTTKTAKLGRFSDVTLNLTPLQGAFLLWDALPGVKTPGLRPLAPSGRRALNTNEAPAYYQGVPPDFAKASSGRPGRFV